MAYSENRLAVIGAAFGIAYFANTIILNATNTSIFTANGLTETVGVIVLVFIPEIYKRVFGNEHFGTFGRWWFFAVFLHGIVSIAMRKSNIDLSNKSTSIGWK